MGRRRGVLRLRSRISRAEAGCESMKCVRAYALTRGGFSAAVEFLAGVIGRGRQFW